MTKAPARPCERGERDELDPHLVLHLQPRIHKLYEQVIASYLKSRAS